MPVNRETCYFSKFTLSFPNHKLHQQQEDGYTYNYHFTYIKLRETNIGASAMSLCCNYLTHFFSSSFSSCCAFMLFRVQSIEPDYKTKGENETSANSTLKVDV